MWRRILVAAVLLAAVAGATVALAYRLTPPAVYQVTDVAPQSTRGTRTAPGLNQSGEVVRAQRDWPDQYACRTFGYRDKVWQDVGVLRKAYGTPCDFNERGQWVGYTWDYPYPEAILYDGRTVRRLGRLDGGASVALAMNDQGQVVGRAQAADGQWHAFVWSEATGMVDLGSLGADGAAAQDINERGHVVGWSATLAGGIHPFLYDGNHMLDLGFIGQANALNARGGIVGWFCSPPTLLTELRRLLHLHWKPSEETAFLYEGGKVWDLNELLAPSATSWTLREALDINDDGVILAVGTSAKAERRLVLAKPRPPARPWALSLGVVLLLTALVAPLGLGAARIVRHRKRPRPGASQTGR